MIETYPQLPSRHDADSGTGQGNSTSKFTFIGWGSAALCNLHARKAVLTAELFFQPSEERCMFSRKKFGLISWLVVVAWTFSACKPAQAPIPGETPVQPTIVNDQAAKTAELTPIELHAGQRLRVVATTNIVADIVWQVAGDAVELSQLLPLGTDPHSYTITPQDMIATTNAHVIFANGANLEIEFLPDLLEQTRAPVVYASQGIEFRHLGEEDPHDDAQQGIDPHTWTTPTNAIVFVHNIERALIDLDPANAPTYQANAQRYQADLEALDVWVKEQIATVPAQRRKLITDHETFGYYADRYGLEQIGAVIPGFSTAAEPSARELAALEDKIREHGVRAVFVGTTINPSLVEQVAEDTGIQLITLYTGSLGPPGSGVETYLDYVRYNTTAIVEGLR
jgi:ABC-type Zn uptake system ZnuABC Zn-binding protein ZnuA